MAIITDIITERTTFPQQYVRVEAVRTTKDFMFIDVGIHFSEELSKETPPHRIENIVGSFDMYSDQNLWQQAYVYIKARWPESTDV